MWYTYLLSRLVSSKLPWFWQCHTSSSHYGVSLWGLTPLRHFQSLEGGKKEYQTLLPQEVYVVITIATTLLGAHRSRLVAPTLIQVQASREDVDCILHSFCPNPVESEFLLLFPDPSDHLPVFLALPVSIPRVIVSPSGAYLRLSSSQNQSTVPEPPASQPVAIPTTLPPLCAEPLNYMDGFVTQAVPMCTAPSYQVQAACKENHLGSCSVTATVCF